MRPEDVKKALSTLDDEGTDIIDKMQPEDGGPGEYMFFEYHAWYTKALAAVRSLAPDRLAEFRGYFEPDPRRKGLGYGNYVIQDYFKNVYPVGHSDFDTKGEAVNALFCQVAIVRSLLSRVDSVFSGLEIAALAGIQDAELESARQLLKVNVRAAGALAGVLLEAHLQKVCQAHGVRIRKKHPTIADLNNPLKEAAVYDVATWRKVSYLGDVRNLCVHKKESEPSLEQVQELIDGVNSAVKNVS